MNLEIEKVGYEVSTYSEELGFDNWFVTENELEPLIQKLEKRASQIISDTAEDTIYIQEVYVDKSDNFGTTADEEAIEKFGHKKLIYGKRLDRKVKLNQVSANFSKIYENKCKKLLDIPPFTQVDYGMAIYQVGDRKVASTDEVYDVTEHYEEIKQALEQIKEK